MASAADLPFSALIQTPSGAMMTPAQAQAQQASSPAPSPVVASPAAIASPITGAAPAASALTTYTDNRTGMGITEGNPNTPEGAALIKAQWASLGITSGAPTYAPDMHDVVSAQNQLNIAQNNPASSPEALSSLARSTNEAIANQKYVDLTWSRPVASAFSSKGAYDKEMAREQADSVASHLTLGGYQGPTTYDKAGNAIEGGFQLGFSSDKGPTNYAISQGALARYNTADLPGLEYLRQQAVGKNDFRTAQYFGNQESQIGESNLGDIAAARAGVMALGKTVPAGTYSALDRYNNLVSDVNNYGWNLGLYSMGKTTGWEQTNGNIMDKPATLWSSKGGVLFNTNQPIPNPGVGNFYPDIAAISPSLAQSVSTLYSPIVSPAPSNPMTAGQGYQGGYPTQSGFGLPSNAGGSFGMGTGPKTQSGGVLESLKNPAVAGLLGWSLFPASAADNGTNGITTVSGGPVIASNYSRNLPAGVSFTGSVSKVSPKQSGSYFDSLIQGFENLPTGNPMPMPFAIDIPVVLGDIYHAGKSVPQKYVNDISNVINAAPLATKVLSAQGNYPAAAITNLVGSSSQGGNVFELKSDYENASTKANAVVQPLITKYNSDLDLYNTNLASFNSNKTESGYNALKLQEANLVSEKSTIDNYLAPVNSAKSKYQTAAGNLVNNVDQSKLATYGLSNWFGGVGSGYENVVEKPIQGFNNMGPVGQFTYGVLDVPRQLTYLGQAGTAGGETLLHNAQNLPGIISAGLAMQGKGTYEMATTNPAGLAGNLVGMYLLGAGVSKGTNAAIGLRDTAGMKYIKIEPIGYDAKYGYPIKPPEATAADLSQSFAEGKLYPAPEKMSIPRTSLQLPEFNSIRDVIAGKPILSRGIFNTETSPPYLHGENNIPNARLPNQEGNILYTAHENPTIMGKNLKVGEKYTLQGTGSSELESISTSPVLESYFNKAGNGGLGGIIGFGNIFRRPTSYITTAENLEVVPKGTASSSEIAARDYSAIDRYMQEQSKITPKAYIPMIKGEYEANIPTGSEFEITGKNYYTKVGGFGDNHFLGTRVPLIEQKLVGFKPVEAIAEPKTNEGSYYYNNNNPIINLNVAGYTSPLGYGSVGRGLGISPNYLANPNTPSASRITPAGSSTRGSRGIDSTSTGAYSRPGSDVLLPGRSASSPYAERYNNIPSSTLSKGLATPEISISQGLPTESFSNPLISTPSNVLSPKTYISSPSELYTQPIKTLSQSIDPELSPGLSMVGPSGDLMPLKIYGSSPSMDTNSLSPIGEDGTDLSIVPLQESYVSVIDQQGNYRKIPSNQQINQDLSSSVWKSPFPGMVAYSFIDKMGNLNVVPSIAQPQAPVKGGAKGMSSSSSSNTALSNGQSLFVSPSGELEIGGSPSGIGSRAGFGSAPPSAIIPTISYPSAGPSESVRGSSGIGLSPSWLSPSPSQKSPIKSQNIPTIKIPGRYTPNTPKISLPAISSSLVKSPFTTGVSKPRSPSISMPSLVSPPITPPLKTTPLSPLGSSFGTGGGIGHVPPKGGKRFREKLEYNLGFGNTNKKAAWKQFAPDAFLTIPHENVNKKVSGVGREIPKISFGTGLLPKMPTMAAPKPAAPKRVAPQKSGGFGISTENLWAAARAPTGKTTKKKGGKKR